MNDPTLLVDIGNTRIKWAVVDATLAGGPPADVRSATHDAAPSPLTDRVPRRVVLSNVASPALATRVLAPWPRIVVDELQSSAQACGVINGYRTPGQLGTDRWAALIGAHALVPDRDLLVCGFGTATTVDLLVCTRDHSGDARFVGGMILPGIEAMRRSLARDTARLPLAVGTPTDFADNTDDAIASGIVAAQVGVVEQAIVHARSRGASGTLLVLLSGGATVHLAAATFPADVRVEAELVLSGLAVVARDRARQYDAR